MDFAGIDFKQELDDDNMFHVKDSGKLDDYFMGLFGITATDLSNEVIWLITRSLEPEVAARVVGDRHGVEPGVVFSIWGVVEKERQRIMEKEAESE